MQQEIYSRHLYLTGEGTNQLISVCEAIMTREKISFNQLVRNALISYTTLHGDQNKNFTLDKFGVTWTTAVSMNKCGFKNCDKMAVGVGLFKPKNQTFGLCAEHFTSAKENPHIWINLKFPKEQQKEIL
jgi:hypothetical protein